MWCLIVSIPDLCHLFYFDSLVIVVSQMNCFMDVTFRKFQSVNIKVCYLIVPNTSLLKIASGRVNLSKTITGLWYLI